MTLAPGEVCIFESELERFDLARALVGLDVAQVDDEAVGELEERRHLVESHVPEVDARKLRNNNPV
jgi:hypothetical protein